MLMEVNFEVEKGVDARVTPALFPHGRLLLCPPAHFDVRYEINPWMHTACAPVGSAAAQQWQGLHHTLIRLGAYVEYIEQDSANPDQVFTANGGLVKNGRAVVSRFRCAERRGEEPFFRDWFKRSGYEVHELAQGAFEGEGDALFAGETLFAGYGMRSQLESYREVAELLAVRTVVPCELIDTYFYHLDLAFCPLNPHLALCYEGGLSADSMRRIRAELEVIPVPKEEAAAFACNSVVLGDQVVMPAHCPKTISALAARGFGCHVVDLSEFQKGGGAAKCLVLRLDRD